MKIVLHCFARESSYGYCYIIAMLYICKYTCCKYEYITCFSVYSLEIKVCICRKHES